MLTEFKHLPGMYVIKEDNNLRVMETVPGDVTLIIGTAPAGPTGLYMVKDTGTAEQVFDPKYEKTGTLLKGMYEAIGAGVKYIALYRIGASPLTLDYLNGYSIIANDATTEAGSKYKIFYTNNLGGGGSTQELLRIFDSKTGYILYDSVAGINKGGFTIYGEARYSGTEAKITIGKYGNDDWQESPTFAAFSNFNNYTLDKITEASDRDAIIDNGELTIVQGTKEFISTKSWYKPGDIITISGSSTSSGSYIVSHTIRDDSGKYHVKLSKKIEYDTNSNTVREVSFNVFSTDETANDGSISVLQSIKYMAPNDGLNMSYNEQYLALQRAYWDLEGAMIDMVIPMEAKLDAPNVVDQSNKYRLDQAMYKLPVEKDYLGKVYEFEHNGSIFMSFKNIFTGENDKKADLMPTPYELNINGYAAEAWLSGECTFDSASVCTTKDDVQGMPKNISYSECNFAYQLASYLDELSIHDNEASGVVSVMPPKSYSRPHIAQWIGKKPVKNANGVIIKNGSGLLGNKFMAGTIDVQEGFFKTTNRKPDGSAVMYRNEKIDIGKYIDIVSTGAIVKTGYEGSSAGYYSSGAALYGATVIKLDPSVAPTNQVIEGKVNIPFTISKKYLDALVGTKYIAFDKKSNGRVKIIDAPTAALSTSDYNRRSVMRIVSTVIDIMRTYVEPSLGNVTNATRLTALEEQLNGKLQDLQGLENQYLQAGQVTLKQTSEMRIKGEAVMRLVLVTANELRRVTAYVSLRK